MAVTKLGLFEILKDQFKNPNYATMGFASAAITAIKNNRSLQRLTSGFKQAKPETARRYPPRKLSGRAMSRVEDAQKRRLWVELLLIGAVLAGGYLLMRWLLF